ncbi:MAG: SDR family NAD(P)-dependent oxidoreductase [Lachnospiraceae bacterium]|jgi:NAD(P)-dependent dehydrogenase (short-subunit alcohol dehydrogenase family)
MVDYKKLFNLEGKRVVVIGGNGGIGGAIAEGFAAVGCKVAVVGRNEAKTQAKADEINAARGTDVVALVADCAVEADVVALVADVKAKLGGCDILVNSQGVNKKSPVIEQDVEVWDQMYAANVRSIMLTCKHFGPMMIEQNWGRVINISSIGAVRCKNDDISTAYGSTKGAVNSLSLNLSAGFAKHGITVNCIAPIITETEMMKPIFEANPAIKTGTVARVPMGRLGLPEDCAKIALFFASDASDFVTGQIIYADGGLCTQQ